MRGASAALGNDGRKFLKIGATAITRALRYFGASPGRGGGNSISPEQVYETYGEWKEAPELAFAACKRSGAPLLLRQSSAVGHE